MDGSVYLPVMGRYTLPSVNGETGIAMNIGEAARESGVTDVESVRKYPNRIVRFTPDSAATSRQLKQFLFKRVYSSEALTADRVLSMQRLSRLFAHLMAHPDLVPRSEDEADTKPLHRAVCDYIAGMTDGYFLKIYNELLG